MEIYTINVDTLEINPDENIDPFDDSHDGEVSDDIKAKLASVSTSKTTTQSSVVRSSAQNERTMDSLSR